MSFSFGATVAVPPVESSDHKRRAEQQAERADEKRQRRENSYRTKTVLTDLTFQCRDGELYYSRRQAAHWSPVLAAALDDPTATIIQVPDYDGMVVELALRFMDMGRFWENHPATAFPVIQYAHQLYKLAHQWEYEELETLIGNVVKEGATWDMLADLKQLHYPELDQAVRIFLQKSKLTADLVGDLVKTHRLLQEEQAQKHRKQLDVIKQGIQRVKQAGYLASAEKELLTQLLAKCNHA